MANVLTLTTPLMRQSVGFDRFNDLFESLLQENTQGFDNYPPYNIEKLGEHDYRITMAVAGFEMDDLNIVLEDGQLRVSGSTKEEEVEEGANFLHRGIAARNFVKTFRLADYIQVEGAELKDGLLTLALKQIIPDEKKPRMIPIGGEGSPAKIGKSKKN